ncbi:Uncharacterized protein OS=Mariniradius saccharolyticus AK6 GN=C943_03553 PE=4 SV=1: DUF2075 [Gemmataceae bacterium]|nr:Uncharacterized protein OS=Mariniradius saccharolyticus AK6 GN=C943_03553 PE=4 SV=1: DUF2075 [Gemmataceae bacterium]VTT98809.1 Uncharacterized protein OS=Mariniradius saccharolyticus AK6 GN=C943_03553 PE=4 SV=1: DUF2075 [Gemmataceae bacterium]
MPSWYKNSRLGFLADDNKLILGCLQEVAGAERWEIPPDQIEEWQASLTALKGVLEVSACHFIDAVIVEYDFRRRGMRIDFILFAPGALFVLEFKRGEITAASRDQVANYCINLVEFHELTQQARPRLFPVVVSRKGAVRPVESTIDWHQDWPQIPVRVAEASPTTLAPTLRWLYSHVSVRAEINHLEWDLAPFNPSSTIIDATISLYGRHDVSAINAHAAPKQVIDRCVEAVGSEIEVATATGGRELILVSGAPGAGKTLVGLTVVFHERYRRDAVFVTGNAPLVDVLNGSLQRSYFKLRTQRDRALGGYTLTGVPFVERNSDFKIVKAHRFLETARRPARSGEDATPRSTDGRVLVFDEAQRTYVEGTEVHRRKLEKDEAMLILEGNAPANDVGGNVWNRPCRNGFGRRIAVDQPDRGVRCGEDSARRCGGA